MWPCPWGICMGQLGCKSSTGGWIIGLCGPDSEGQRQDYSQSLEMAFFKHPPMISSTSLIFYYIRQSHDLTSFSIQQTRPDTPRQSGMVSDNYSQVHGYKQCIHIKKEPPY